MEDYEVEFAERLEKAIIKERRRRGKELMEEIITRVPEILEEHGEEFPEEPFSSELKKARKNGVGWENFRDKSLPIIFGTMSGWVGDLLEEDREVYEMLEEYLEPTT